MNWRVVIVWSIKIIIALVILWMARRWLHGFDQAYSSRDPYAVINAFLKYIAVFGIILAIFFLDIVTGISGRMTGFLFPEVGDVELHPEYSIAEARVREGKYREAINEFRKVWNDYPNDVMAHVRIAELLCQYFQKYDEAVTELRAALNKKCKPEAWAFVANRLVDVQVEHLHDFVTARETLQQIILKFPSSRYCEAAKARVLALNDTELHEQQPVRPPLRVRDSSVEGTS